MKRFYSLSGAVLLTLIFSMPGQAQQPAAQSSASAQMESAASESSAAGMGEEGWVRMQARRARNGRNNNDVVAIGSNSSLAANEQADNVVSVLGSSSNDGTVRDSVVSVLGNTRVTGPVGQNAVAVLGNVYVNSRVNRDVVAVLGNVELGPQAQVAGQVVAVLGQVTRDPAAVVRGGIQHAGGQLVSGYLSWDWLKVWVKHCFMYGRPLAFAPGLGWAWTLALGSLALYVLTALIYPRGVQRCVETLVTQPGRSLLAALVATFLTPLLFAILLITLIGILAIPFAGLALLALSSFGKLVMLAWLGGLLMRTSRDSSAMQVALATLLGGLIVTALYVVPLFGFIVYHALNFVGFGVVVYTLLLAMQARRVVHEPPAGGAAVNSRQAFTPSSVGNAGSDGLHAQTAGDEPDNAAQFTQTNTAAAYETTRPAAAVALTYPRAGFGIRMGALFIDGVLALILFSWLPGHFLVPLAAYGALMWKLRGTTIGGIVCHLQVVRIDGRELDWPTVIVRALSCFLSLFVLGAGFFWIINDREKQGWHDKLAGTVVVRAPRFVSLV